MPSLFFLHTRPPPTATLFPYTTLFRSVLGTFGVERHAITFRGQAAHSGSTPMNRDRKSTRLNSSHVKISYAVFCLKKKRSECQRLENQEIERPLQHVAVSGRRSALEHE